MGASGGEEGVEAADGGENVGELGQATAAHDEEIQCTQRGLGGRGGPARAGTKAAGGGESGHGVAARTKAAEVRTERDASSWSERSAHQISDTRKFGAVMGEADRDAW